jgi:hypothetical protein
VILPWFFQLRDFALDYSEVNNVILLLVNGQNRGKYAKIRGKYAKIRGKITMTCQ